MVENSTTKTPRGEVRGCGTPLLYSIEIINQYIQITESGIQCLEFENSYKVVGIRLRQKVIVQNIYFAEVLIA